MKLNIKLLFVCAFLTFGLKAQVYVQLNVVQSEKFSVSKISDEFACIGETVTLNADAGYKTYLWNTSDEGSSITVDTSGIYTVNIKNENNCIASDTVHVEFKVCTGLTLQQMNNLINVYPVPAKQFFVVEGPITDNAYELTLFNSVGKKIIFLENTHLPYIVIIETLPPGSYILEIITDKNQRIFKKILIEK